MSIFHIYHHNIVAFTFLLCAPIFRFRARTGARQVSRRARLLAQLGPLGARTLIGRLWSRGRRGRVGHESPVAGVRHQLLSARGVAPRRTAAGCALDSQR